MRDELEEIVMYVSADESEDNEDDTLGLDAFAGLVGDVDDDEPDEYVSPFAGLDLANYARSYRLPSRLGEWRDELARNGKVLTSNMLPKVWLAGLKNFGVNARTALEWGQGVKPRPLPYVIEFDCPFGHRTADQRRDATVRLIVLEDGWVMLDREPEPEPGAKATPSFKGQCMRCNPSLIEQWLVMCPRCEADEIDPWHWAGHFPLEHEHGRPSGETEIRLIGDLSPVSFVLDELRVLTRIAKAEYTIAHREEASEYELSHAQQILQKTPKARGAITAGSAGEGWDESRTKASLEALGIPMTASAAAAWRQVHDFEGHEHSPEGHPPKWAIEKWQRSRLAADPAA